ncbi:MAG: PAS domain-containing protein, partial [Candidatus Omnitrophica bacterium]|nr:PAS domain-containing protein [Candidatus Omnitrophota bacterium]
RKVSYGQLIHPDDRAALQQEIGAAIKEKKPFKFIYRIKTATGKKKWVWEQGRSIFSFYDKTLIIEGFITDITDRKHIEEELKAAFDELKITQDQLIQSEKFSAIGRLASGVAHEVKNPLAVILQGIEYLQNKLVTDDETVTTALQCMYAAVGRANNIIKGMLDFSSISIMKKKPCSLNAIIENSLLLLKNDLDRYHVNVVADLMPDLPNISIDKNRIEQVLINLLINATQAMPEGGRLTVKTYMKEKNKKVVVEIEDTGYGIPKDILGKIFDPFFTTKLHIGGAGLGLSIVRNIIGKHEGTIKVENKKSGQGTIVFLEFKL